MQRRGFLSAILAAGMAPAVVGSGILMPIKSIARVDPFGQFGFIDLIKGVPPMSRLEYERAMMDGMRIGTGMFTFRRCSMMKSELEVLRIDPRDVFL